MKALSGRQPWWWAILHAGKRIENRTWNTNYRGPILLHAAKGCTQVEYFEAVDWMVNAGVVGHESDVPPIAGMRRGGIVGCARIVDVIPIGPRRWPLDGIDLRWKSTDQYGFVLADVEALPFVPCRGALGLFELDADGVRPQRGLGVST